MLLPFSKFSINGLVVIDDGEDGIPATKATIVSYRISKITCLKSCHLAGLPRRVLTKAPLWRNET